MNKNKQVSLLDKISFNSYQFIVTKVNLFMCILKCSIFQKYCELQTTKFTVLITTSCFSYAETLYTKNNILRLLKAKNIITNRKQYADFKRCP